MTDKLVKPITSETMSSFHGFLKRLSLLKLRKKLLLKKSKTQKTPLKTTGRSRNGRIGRSPIYKDTILTKQSTPLPPKAAKAAQGEGEVKKLIKIWKEYTGDTSLDSLRGRETQRLLKLFTETCKGNFEIWKNFCRMIGENKFLNGKASTIGWKVTLQWLLRPRNLEKILLGNYGLKISEIYAVAKSTQDCVAEVLENHQSLPAEEASSYGQILQNLADRVGGQSVISWFKSVSLGGMQEGLLRLLAPSKFQASYIETHFRSKLLEAAKTAGLSDVEITCHA